VEDNKKAEFLPLFNTDTTDMMSSYTLFSSVQAKSGFSCLVFITVDPRGVLLVIRGCIAPVFCTDVCNCNCFSLFLEPKREHVMLPGPKKHYGTHSLMRPSVREQRPKRLREPLHDHGTSFLPQQTNPNPLLSVRSTADDQPSRASPRALKLHSRLPRLQEREL
jgi:hypothetical protein